MVSQTNKIPFAPDTEINLIIPHTPKTHCSLLGELNCRTLMWQRTTE